MTQAEQASLEAIRMEMNAGFRELRQQIEKFDARLRTVETSRSVGEAFFDFGKYLLTTGVALGAVLIVLYH